MRERERENTDKQVTLVGSVHCVTRIGAIDSNVYIRTRLRFHTYKTVCEPVLLAELVYLKPKGSVAEQLAHSTPPAFTVTNRAGLWSATVRCFQR